MRVYALRRPGAPVMLIGTVAEIRARRRVDAERPESSLSGRPRPDGRGGVRRARVDAALVGLDVLGWTEGDEATAQAWRERGPLPDTPKGVYWTLAGAELLNAIRAGWNAWDGADHRELGVAPLRARGPRVPHLVRRRRR